MHATKTCLMGNREEIENLPILLLTFSILMIPIAGTGYAPIFFAYAVFMYLIWKDKGVLVIESSVLKGYARYYFTFIFISVVVGLINGVSIYAQIADVTSSTIPFVSMYIGCRYALKITEEKMIKVVSGLLLIEVLFGLGQTISPGFREFSFSIYGAAERLISYVAEDVGRAVGTIGSPNYYGILCVILSVSVLPGCIMQKLKINAFLILFMGIMCVIFSVSKTSALCIGIAAILWCLTNSRFTCSMKILTCIIAVAIVLIAIDQFQSFSNRTINLMTLSGRSNSWTRILSEFTRGNLFSQFFGYGNGFSTLKFFGVYADSFYIILLIEQGYVGITSYVITWMVLLFMAFRMPNRTYSQTLIILIILVLLADVTAAITDNPNVAIAIYFVVGRYSRLAEVATLAEDSGSNRLQAKN